MHMLNGLRVRNSNIDWLDNGTECDLQKLMRSVYKLNLGGI